MRKILIYIFVCLNILLSACSQVNNNQIKDNLTQSNNQLFIPFSEGEKYGYINSEGHVVIKPEYEYAGRFSSGLAPFMRSGEFGYINCDNEVVIMPKYTNAYDFVNGLALVSIGEDENLRWGYIDTKGNEIAKPQFISAENFTSDGYALVSVLVNDKDVNGFINETGKVFLPDDYEISSRFSDGLACIKKNGQYGFIDTNFNIGIAPQYEFATDFGNGIAYARVNVTEQYMINKKGDIVKPVNDVFGHFSDGLATICQNNKWGFINTDGEIAIEPKFAKALMFSNRLSAIQQRTEDGYKWGFIDTNGNTVIEPKYDSVYDFGDYIYASTNEGEYYILNRTGRKIYSGSSYIESTPSP